MSDSHVSEQVELIATGINCAYRVNKLCALSHVVNAGQYFESVMSFQNSGTSNVDLP